MCGLFILLISLSARAADSTPEILVQAPRILDQSIEASRSVDIVNAKEIAAQKPQTVADVLRDLPGVEVVRQGSVGQTTSIFIRGARSEDTLVLIDGVQANDAMAPSLGYDFSSLSPENIERVEIYRGPQSVRFGGGALGGVINIVTKEGAGAPHGQYSFERGSYDTARGMLGFLGESHALHYSVAIDGYQTHGFSAADVRDGNTESDGQKMGSASGKLLWIPDAISRVSASFRYIKTATDLDRQGGPGGDDPNDVGRMMQFLTAIEGQHRFFNDRLKSTLGYYYSETKRSNANPPDSMNSDDSWDRYLSENQKVESNHEFTITDHDILRLNLQWRNESGGSTSFFNGTSTIVARQQQSDFGEGVTYLYDSSSWFGDAGLRLDEQSRIGNIPSERLSIGYNFAAIESRLSLTYGTGFKAPSLFQLYSQYGSPDLHWESSETYELTFEKKWDSRFASSVALFQNNFHNMIDFDPSSNKYLNVSSARSKGVEVRLTASLSAHWKLDGNYTFLDAVDETTGLSLPRRPPHAANLTARYHREKWETYSQIHFESARPDVDPSNGQLRISDTGYATVNIGGAYALWPEFKIQARVENLLDRKYEEVAGYGTPGFSFYLGCSGEIW